MINCLIKVVVRGMRKLTMLVGVIFLLAQMLFLLAPKLASANGITPLVETQTRSVATNLGLYGAYTWDIARDPNSNYVYLAAGYTPNGFFRSADGGLTWSGLPKNVDYGSGQEVEVNSANSHVYALLKSFIVSTDNGATFVERTEAGTNNSSFIYTQGKIFLGGGDGTVKISSDEAVSFSTVTIEAGTVIRSLAASSDALYAISRNYGTNIFKLYKSTNWGSAWTDLNIAASGITQPEKVVVNPNTDHVFLLPTSSSGESAYRSADGGASWTVLASTTPASGNASFDSTGRMYMGWKYSTDEGDSWTVLQIQGNYAHSIFVDPTDDNILYDTTAPGFSKSADRGLTWTTSVEGITGTAVLDVVQAKDKNIVWVATQNGLAKTVNFLSDVPTWQYPISTAPDGTIYSSGRDSIWVKPDDSNKVVVSNSAAIMYSTDGGTTWATATTAIDMANKVALQIVGDKNNILYAAVGSTTGDYAAIGGVMKSTDDGATWQSLDFPSNAATQSVAVAKNGDLYVGAGVKAHQLATSETVKGLYKYDKSADKWSKLDLPNLHYPAVIVDPENANVVYALATGWPSSKKAGFYKSTDAGATWTHVTSGLSNFIEFTTMTVQKSTRPNTLYLAGTNKDYKGVIYKSSDLGERWGLFYTGLINEEFNTLLFDGLLGGNERGLYSLKSKAKVGVAASAKTVKKGKKVAFTVTLKDAATKKKLSKRYVALYKKVGKKWVKVKTKKTNKNARAVFSAKVKKNIIFQVRFKPKKKSDKSEYALSKSKRIKIKVKY
ncbi:MAG: hypothetical protein AB1465_00605 [Patescibacteria group bacterium]